MFKKTLRTLALGVLITLILIFGIGKISDLFGESPTAAFIGLGDSDNDLDGSKEAIEEEKVIEYNNLLLKVLELRQSHINLDIIQTAELVTEIEDKIDSLENDPITDNWETIALCLAGTCGDDDFLDFILTITLEGDKIGLTNGKLIVNLLTANKYWNTDNTVKFSQAVTDTNQAIKDLSDETISSKWLEIVECDGSCSDKDTLMFDIIELLAE